jgi:heme exporter protein C
MVAVAAVIARALFFTPRDALQGEAQRILYVHAPAAWVAMMGFISVGVAGVLYLMLRDERLDRFGAAAVEVALVFITVVLVTGPLWARPIWGGWWNWGDARLTSTLVLWMVYLGYMVMRGAVEDVQLRARYCAIIGILGALLVPFVHISVYLFNSAHPDPVVATPDVFSRDRSRIDGRMLLTLMLSLAASMLLFVAFVRARYRLALETEASESLSGRESA